MHKQLARYAIVAVGCGLLTLAACERKDQSGITTGMGRSPSTDTAPISAPGRADTTTTPSTALTDANIVALLDEANQADSAAGMVAATKATDPDVRAFAKLMMSEHHALRVQGQQLAKKLNVTPAAPANDPVQAAAAKEMAALRSAAKGAEFDRTYIDHEIAVHKAVIDLAEQAHAATRQEQLKALIVQAKPVLQKHLDRAQGLQRKLGKPGA